MNKFTVLFILFIFQGGMISLMANKQFLKDTQENVRSILKEKNIDYNDWKREVINKRKLFVMSDEDKKWIEQVVLEESLMVIVEDHKEKRNQPSTSNHQNL